MALWLRRRLGPPVLVACLAIIAAVLPATVAHAQVGAGGRVIPAAEPVPGQYIVTLRGGGVPSVDAATAALTAKHGGRVIEVYENAVRGYAVATTPAGAQELADDPAVAAVEQDGVVRATTTQTPAPSWGLDRIDQSSLPLNNSYSFSTGAPDVHAYIIDTGINMSLADFGGRATFGVDEVGGVTPPGSDCHGHGTHVAGTVGGSTYGVAKQVSLVSVRVLGCSGSGTTSAAIAGVDWVTANGVRPAVVNMSLGGSLSASLDDAVNTSIAVGFTYTVAAGNDNSDACLTSPSDVANAIVVGATDQTDARASYSNWGSCVDLFAPGSGIVSDFASAPFTKTVSGTSMAAPHVAGVAAQYLERIPNAAPATVASAVTTNATAGIVPNPNGSPNRLLYNGFVPAGAPDPPLLSASGADGVVHLAWTITNDGGSPIDHFTVARGTTAGAETTLAPNVSGSALGYDDASVANGTSYYYKVTATNAAGTSGPSNEVRGDPISSTSAIAHYYADLGGSGSFLGAPTGPEQDVAGGRQRVYEGGAIYWSTQTGAHEVHGAILARYRALGGPSSFAGFPETDEQDVSAGRRSTFEHADIYWSPPTGAHEVHGAILTRYATLGGASSFAGFPTTDELPTPDGVGRYNHFQRASIYWSPSTGAHEVHGAIRDKWASLGWELGFLGYPVTDELPTPDGVGRYTHFQRGSIYWTPQTGAHEVHGAIRDKWASLGWELGSLGYPVTDELATPDGVGRYTHFQRGSIYWTPQTGAHEVHGAIRDKWASLGWELGSLGYPVTDETPTLDGAGRYNDFQRGSIFWTPQGGAHETLTTGASNT